MPDKQCENCRHMEKGTPENPCYDCKGWRWESDKPYWEPREER